MNDWGADEGLLAVSRFWNRSQHNLPVFLSFLSLPDVGAVAASCRQGSQPRSTRSDSRCSCVRKWKLQNRMWSHIQRTHALVLHAQLCVSAFECDNNLAAQVQGNHTVVVPRGRGYVSMLGLPGGSEDASFAVCCVVLVFQTVTVSVMTGFPALRKRRGSRTGSD